VLTKACVIRIPVARASMMATRLARTPLTSANPTISGVNSSSEAKAAGVKVSPTCAATVIWPKGRVRTGILIRARPLA
jgi:hypothetical protein